MKQSTSLLTVYPERNLEISRQIFNAKINENKITKEVTHIEEPPQQNNEDNEGLRNEDNSNALEFN